MEETKWELLTETLGSAEAELMKLYFESCEIPLKTFEEAATSSVLPVTFGRVRVYVEKKNLAEARKLLLEYESQTR